MKLAIVTAATKSYLYAWQACVRSIAAAAAHYPDAHFIFCTDQSEEAKLAAKMLKEELPEGWKITTINLPIKDDEKDYKTTAQLRIAALQGAGFAFAKTKVRADLLWSVESDNIVPANALRVLEWALAMPQAEGTPVYDIAAGTYVNGSFLGGFGTPFSQINKDFLPCERKMTPRLIVCLDATEDRLKKGQSEKESNRMKRLMDLVEKCPPDGTLWEVIQKHGWRRRGWLEAAYPGIGWGSLVPGDWCGLGCTLMNKKALMLADFAGYEGHGTQDLFLCWQRWHPAGLKLAIVPHVACDHVKRDEKGKLIHHVAYHEQQGECRGHLRTKRIPWIGDPLAQAI